MGAGRGGPSPPGRRLAPHAPEALFSMLDLIASDPPLPGARAHVVSGGHYFGSESELVALIR